MPRIKDTMIQVDSMWIKDSRVVHKMEHGQNGEKIFKKIYAMYYINPLEQLFNGDGTL